MKLWIGRHAYAGNPSKDPQTERERPLTTEGKATAKAIAMAMRTAGESPKVIFCSPFTRTVMTADIYGAILGIQVNIIGELSPMRPMEDGILGLINKDRIKRIMLVCHVDNTGPAMRNFDDSDKWPDLVMAEVRRVDMDRKDGSWSLKWRLRPSDLGLKDYDA